MRRLFPKVSIGLLATIACGGSSTPPTPTQWATDTAGYIEPGEVQALNVKLRAYQQRTDHHMLVWITNRRLGPEKLEDFTFRAFNSWGIGRDGHDDGIVVFVFPADRKIRIEVGYGLERLVPDAEATRILVEARPLFKTEPGKGLHKIVDDLIRLTEGR